MAIVMDTPLAPLPTKTCAACSHRFALVELTDISDDDGVRPRLLCKTCLKRTASCLACKEDRFLDQFPIGDGSQRKKICSPCWERIDSALKSGEAASAVSVATGASVATLRRRRMYLGLEPERVTAPVGETAARAIELFRTHDVAEIANILHVTPRHVRRVLLQAKLVEPHRVRAGVLDLDWATLLLEDGASYAETARTINVDVKTIAEALPGYEPDADARRLTAYLSKDSHAKRLHREIQALAVPPCTRPQILRSAAA